MPPPTAPTTTTSPSPSSPPTATGASSAFKWKSAGISSRPQSDAVLAIAINPSNGALIAGGHFDGTVVLYDSNTLQLVAHFNVCEERRAAGGDSGGGEKGDIDTEIQTKHPITALAFRPQEGRGSSKAAKNLHDAADDDEEVLLITTSDGLVERRVFKCHRNTTSNTLSLKTARQYIFRDGEPTSSIIKKKVAPTATNSHDHHENGSSAPTTTTTTSNEVYAATYNKDGSLFATCGLDGMVRIYDDFSLKLVHVLRTKKVGFSSSSSLVDGSLRLQSVRFCAKNPNIVAAAGWGQTVHFWDISAPNGGVADDDDGPFFTTQPSEEGGGLSNNAAIYTRAYPHQEVFGPYAIGQGIAIGGGGDNACNNGVGELIAVSFRGQDRIQTMAEPTEIVASRPSLSSSATSSHHNLHRAASNANAAGSGSGQLRLSPQPWPAGSKTNFFPTCVAISPRVTLPPGTTPTPTTAPIASEYFIAMGGGGGMGLTEAGMVLSGTSRAVASEFLAVGCVNCCTFGVVVGGGSGGNSLIVAFGDSKGNVQAARCPIGAVVVA